MNGSIAPGSLANETTFAEDFEVLWSRGDPALAEVFVARTSCGLVEFVDGLDPPRTRREKWIVNVSTQCGCPVGCPYCDAGWAYRGDLTVGEILAQISYVLSRYEPELPRRCSKLKVHFARMGEPALNDNVLEALRALRRLLPWSGVWACLATTAPRQAAGFFEELLVLKDRLFPGRFQLQFSVNSTDEAEREALVPLAHWHLEEIAAYGRRFWRPGDRKVVLNFALAEGVTFQPEVIARTFSQEAFTVKLTPVNPTERGRRHGFETVLRRPQAQERLSRAIQELRRAGFDVVVSVGDPGEDAIGSNCGQSVRVFEARGFGSGEELT